MEPQIPQEIQDKIEKQYPKYPNNFNGSVHERIATHNRAIDMRSAAAFGYSLAIPQWISVGDRLPEKGQACLFIVNAPNDHNHGRVLGGKYTHSNDFSVPGIGYDAKYWMPMDFLPPAPKE